MKPKTMRSIIRFFMRLFTNIKVYHLENLPSSGACIAVGNHLGRLDAFLPFAYLERDDLTMMAADKYKKVPYTAFALSAEKHSAIETAQMLAVPPEIVFKTIVVVREGKGKPILAIVPGPAEVDLKMLAKAVGEKKLQLPTEKEAERLTGLQAGGISPLALLNRGFQMVLDETAQLWDEIHISGGQRGLNLRLRVDDLIGLIAPSIAEISHEG